MPTLALATPTLVAATPDALLGASEAPLARPAYALRYALAGTPGATLVQRVETRVRLLRGDSVVVEYHAVEWEYFTLALGPPEARVDLHDFDARRDGWAPADVAALLRRRGRRAPDGAARLEVQKDFLLGPGEVDGPHPAHVTAGGGAFGLLAGGEGEAARVTLVLSPGGDPVEAAPRPPPAPRIGVGRLLAGPRLAAVERLSFTPATASGRVERRGYAPASRSPGGAG
ncbi:MAG: hypothetical protein KF878_01865 [Planctomycetes bacterium]|nr:hypothetical protein [Planctomycetota bacterium]